MFTQTSPPDLLQRVNICSDMMVLFVTVHAKRWDKSAKIADYCGFRTNGAVPVLIENLVLLARCVFELWLLLYTVYKTLDRQNGNICTRITR